MSNYIQNEEKEIIEVLRKNDSRTQSMRVVGRGTLVMSARDARNSQKFKDLLNKAEHIVKD